MPKKDNANSSPKTTSAESTTKSDLTPRQKRHLLSAVDVRVASVMKEGLKGYLPSDVLKVSLTFLDKLLNECISRDLLAIAHATTVGELKKQGFDEDTAKRILAVILLCSEIKRSKHPLKDFLA